MPGSPSLSPLRWRCRRPRAPDEAAVLYDPASVSRVDLTLSEEAEQAVLDEPSEYVPGTLGYEVLRVARAAFPGA